MQLKDGSVTKLDNGVDHEGDRCGQKRGVPPELLVEVDALLTANKGKPRYVQNQLILDH